MGYSGDLGANKALFKVGSAFDKVLSLSIKKPEVLNVNLTEEIYNEKVPLLSCKINAMKPKADSYEGKVYLELNRHGIVSVQKVEMTEKVEVEEKVPIKKEKKKEEKKDEK